MSSFLKCRDCGHIFSESDADVTRTTYESMYGVSHLFPYSTPCSYYTCPHCGSEDLDDVVECVDGDTLCDDCGCLGYEEDMYTIFLGMYLDIPDEPSLCFECWLKRVSASSDAMNYWINYFSTDFSEDWPEYIEDYNSVKDKSIIDILIHLNSVDLDIIGDRLCEFCKVLKNLWIERR